MLELITHLHGEFFVARELYLINLSIILAKGSPGFCCEQSGKNLLCYDKTELHLISRYADWCDLGTAGIWGVAAHQGYDWTNLLSIDFQHAF